jgi:hypothetical protein
VTSRREPTQVGRDVQHLVAGGLGRETVLSSRPQALVLLAPGGHLFVAGEGLCSSDISEWCHQHDRALNLHLVTAHIAPTTLKRPLLKQLREEGPYAYRQVGRLARDVIDEPQEALSH